MQAAEEDFELARKASSARARSSFPNADRAKLEPMLKDLGLSAWAVATAPAVRTHELDVPRIGYVHSWSRTQDEGWVRAALDTYGVPYTYFGDIKLREGNLRAKYDVIIFPHVGGNAQSQVNGIAEDRHRAASVQEERRSTRRSAPSTPPMTSAAAWDGKDSSSS